MHFNNNDSNSLLGPSRSNIEAITINNLYQTASNGLGLNSTLRHSGERDSHWEEVQFQVELKLKRFGRDSHQKEVKLWRLNSRRSDNETAVLRDRADQRKPGKAAVDRKSSIKCHSKRHETNMCTHS